MARLAVLLAVIGGLPFAECRRPTTVPPRAARAAACEAGRAYDAESLLARPDVRAWLSDHESWYPDAHADAAVLRDESGTLIVAALGWEGPPQGAVLLFSCEGRLLDVEQTAGIDTLDIVTFDSPTPALARLRYRVGGATGYRNEGIELYAVRDSTLRVATV